MGLFEVISDSFKLVEIYSTLMDSVRWDFWILQVLTYNSSTQPPIQWVPRAPSPGVRAARAWSWPLTSI